MKINFLEKIVDKISSKFLNRKNSDNSKNVLNNSNAGDMAGRDLYKTELLFSQSGISASKLEKKLLKLLYLEYEKNGVNNGKKVPHAYKELDIKYGSDISTLNDSKLIKIENDFFKMTSDGIRYIENLKTEDINDIVLPSEKKEWDELMRQEEVRIEENRRNSWKNSAR